MAKTPTLKSIIKNESHLIAKTSSEVTFLLPLIFNSQQRIDPHSSDDPSE